MTDTLQISQQSVPSNKALDLQSLWWKLITPSKPVVPPGGFCTPTYFMFQTV